MSLYHHVIITIQTKTKRAEKWLVLLIYKIFIVHFISDTLRLQLKNNLHLYTFTRTRVSLQWVSKVSEYFFHPWLDLISAAAHWSCSAAVWPADDWLWGKSTDPLSCSSECSSKQHNWFWFLFRSARATKHIQSAASILFGSQLDSHSLHTSSYL